MKSVSAHIRLVDTLHRRLMKLLALCGWIMSVCDLRDGKPEDALLFLMCAICLGELSKWRRV